MAKSQGNSPEKKKALEANRSFSNYVRGLRAKITSGEMSKTEANSLRLVYIEEHG